MVLLLEGQAGRDLARQLEHLAAQPALLALRALHLLLVDYSVKVEVVAVVAMLALAVLAAQEAEVLAVVAVVQHAVHTPLALVA